MCHNTWSWCIQGQIPHDLILLWDIKVNAQVLQRAAIDESLRIKCHYLQNVPRHYYLLDTRVYFQYFTIDGAKQIVSETEDFVIARGSSNRGPLSRNLSVIGYNTNIRALLKQTSSWKYRSYQLRKLTDGCIFEQSFFKDQSFFSVKVSLAPHGSR